MGAVRVPISGATLPLTQTSPAAPPTIRVREDAHHCRLAPAPEDGAALAASLADKTRLRRAPLPAPDPLGP